MALRLGVELDLVAAERLRVYFELLQRWNASYNLTAVRDPAAVISHHLADCLAVVAPLRRKLATADVGGAPRLLDVGSGAGLPGLILALAHPEWRVTCVDSVGKKAAFMRQAAGAMELENVVVEAVRIETLVADPFDAVVSRAFSSLAVFVTQTERLLSPEGIWMAMKGKPPIDEASELPAAVDLFHVEPLKIPDLHADRCLVWMKRALTTKCNTKRASAHSS